MNENPWPNLQQRRMSCLALLRGSARLGLGAAGLALVGCGGDDDDDEAEEASSDRSAGSGGRGGRSARRKNDRGSHGAKLPHHGDATGSSNLPRDQRQCRPTSVRSRPHSARRGWAPLDETGAAVDEGGGNLTVVGKIVQITTGESVDTTIDLEAGRYILFCNIPGHYAAGMIVEFEVS